MIKTRFANLDDIDEVKKIIDEGISQDYYSIDTIRNYITDENSMLLVVVSDDDKPQAAMFCMKGNLKQMCEEEHIPYPDSVFEGYSENSQTIVYKTASTYKNMRNRGYVTRLFDAYGDIFDNTEHELRVGLALVLPDGTIPIKKQVDNAGFTPRKLYKSPWSKIKSYCNYCNCEYCQCNGMLYIKENNIEEKI